MQMNVRPIPTASERINHNRSLTAKIVNEEILPFENELWASRRSGGDQNGARAKAHERRAHISE